MSLIRLRLTLPRLQTSLSSVEVTSVQAFLNVSSSWSKKLNENPGSEVDKACSQFFKNMSP